MAENQPVIDMFRQLAQNLQLPRMDVDRLIESHRKNLEAIGRSMQVAAEGATSVANKQREILESAVREMTAMIQNYKPATSTQEFMDQQREFTKRAIEAAVQNTREVAELIRKSNTDALAVLQERMRESLEELRASYERKR